MVLLQAENLGPLKEFADNSIAIAMLIVGVWLMWKRDERYRRKQEDKMTELEKQIRDYIEIDRKRTDEMLNRAIAVQHDTNEIMKENNDVIKQTNRILDCFVPEMLDFKASPLFKDYLKSKTKTH